MMLLVSGHHQPHVKHADCGCKADKHWAAFAFRVGAQGYA